MNNQKENLKSNQKQQKEKSENKEEKEFHDIYDRVFKRIFSMSALAIINLINALFGTYYPTNSKVVYLNKEFVSRKLNKRFADVFLQIEGVTYHLEAQMKKDKSIVVRVLEYGFYHALEEWDDENVLKFPEPVVIYLNNEKNIPKISTLTMDFGTQGKFQYQVTNFVYQEHDVRELNQKKMIILIPFQLLKLQSIIEENPTESNFKLLQNLILNDILGSIKANLAVGNITSRDANELKSLTLQLYDHIYQHYEKTKGGQEMRTLLKGAMELPNDKYWDHLEEVEAERDQLKTKTEELETKTEELETKTEALETKTEALETKTEALEIKNVNLTAENDQLKKELELLRQK